VNAAIRRAVLAGITVIVAGLGAVAIGAPPERCPAVTHDTLRASATAAAQWFVTNQARDGTWLYLYNAAEDEAADDYNVVRHAGAVLGLYMAAAADIRGALESADRGRDWLLRRVVSHDDWDAIVYNGEVSAGTVALFAAGLVERRILTGDASLDEPLERLGRFLVAQTERSGAVLAYYDERADAPVAESYSKYYTGETYWALARLHRLFPNAGWGDTANRIGEYVAAERDEVEDYWPPLPDHWAAYGLSETVAFGDRPPARPLTDDEVAYAHRQADLFGAQVRWVAQRFGPWGQLVRGPHVPRGGGYGVVGEALTGLWRVAEAEPRLASLRAPIAERARCIAGLAINAQSDEAEASAFPEPDRVRGAWFRDGSTRMDDQQHALAALLRTEAIVAAAPAGSDGPSPSGWLWLIALIAAMNPLRVAVGVPRAARPRPEILTIAALGALVGGALAFTAAAAAQPLLDAIDVSAPAFRIAAAAVGGVAAIAAFARRPPPPDPALPGRRAALVPIAVPLVASPGLLLLSVSAYADRGAAFVAGALVVAGALAVAATVLLPARGPERRLAVWAMRLVAAVALATSVLLIIDGIFDV
jgi:small neutral amino acid transporter SnatA (MarC family)